MIFDRNLPVWSSPGQSDSSQILHLNPIYFHHQNSRISPGQREKTMNSNNILIMTGWTPIYQLLSDSRYLEIFCYLPQRLLISDPRKSSNIAVLLTGLAVKPSYQGFSPLLLNSNLNPCGRGVTPAQCTCPNGATYNPRYPTGYLVSSLSQYITPS